MEINLEQIVDKIMRISEEDGNDTADQIGAD